MQSVSAHRAADNNLLFPYLCFTVGIWEAISGFYQCAKQTSGQDVTSKLKKNTNILAESQFFCL